MSVIVVAAAAAAGMAGCEARPIPADGGGRNVYEDDSTAAHVRIVQQDSDRIQGGLLRVRTIIRNRTDEGVWVEIQMVWKDGKGYEIHKTNWAPFHIPARMDETHEIASLRPDVVDYQLRIRRPARSVRR
jgi:hypothetical protein